MTYISLYRKYRSQTFEEIAGQNHITTTLKNAVGSGRITHAYLFSGPRGTGKTSTARILAKALNCEKGPTPDPCNECHICDSITRDLLFDVIEIDAASNRGIDDIRDLKEKVRVPPVEARFKVYIIDEAHMLTREAFNALLKTLEEPPPKVIFVLATTEPQKLPLTILSRCQRFDFRRIPPRTIREHLSDIARSEKFEVEPEALDLIVHTADGSMRDAISLLDQLVSYSGGDVSTEHFLDVAGAVRGGEAADFLSALIDGDAARGFRFLDGFFQEGKSAALFLRLFLEHLRDLYFLKAGIEPGEGVGARRNGDGALKAQAERLSAGSIVEMMDEASRVEERIRWENYPRVVLEIMMVKLLHSLNREKAGAETAMRREKAAVEKSRPAERPPETPPPEQPGEDTLPEIAGEITIGLIRRRWNHFLAGFKKQYLPTCIILSFGFPHSLENDTLTLAYDRDHQFHKEQMTEPANAEKVESALDGYFGKPLKLKVRSIENIEGGRVPKKAPEPPAPAGGRNLSIIDMIHETFPGSREV
ncbi:MAG: DNA polymerase III subunit gamma/tau [bacterium]